jgi:hypothetical protein
VPFAEYRPDHRAGVELATIDADRAAEAAADIERRSAVRAKGLSPFSTMRISPADQAVGSFGTTACPSPHSQGTAFDG